MWNPGATQSRFLLFSYNDVIMTSWTRPVARHPRIPILGLLITSSRCIRVRTLVQDSYCALKPVLVVYKLQYEDQRSPSWSSSIYCSCLIFCPLSLRRDQIP